MPARALQAPVADPADTEAPHWRDLLRPSYLLSLIRDNLPANTLLILALVIGFFHGWLKMRFPGGIMVFAYDIPLMAALALSISKISPGHKLFPKSRTSSALQVVLAICIVYGLLPTEIPILVRLAAFRGWALVPLTFLMGYHLFRSREQLYLYGWLIMILSVGTVIYGARQDPEELRRMAMENQTLENVMKGSFYGDEEGTKFRVFSTFVSAGAFGATMAYSVLIGLGRLSRPGTPMMTRILLAALMLPISYGILLSASRSAAIIAGISILLIAWYRKALVKFAILPGIVLGILLVATSRSGGSSVSRMSVAADPDALMSRVSIVVRPAFNRLLEAPLGGGLGRSGHGLPAALGYLCLRFKWKPVDGDIGRVAVDFGVFGLVAFAAMFIAGTQDSFLWMKELKGTELDTAAVTAGAMFVTAFISFPTGSPFLAIPMGAIIWFYLGALNRLYDDHKAHLPTTVRPGAEAASPPGLSPGPEPVQNPKARLRLPPPAKVAHSVRPTGQPAKPPPTPGLPANSKPKRFLYTRGGSKSNPRT